MNIVADESIKHVEESESSVEDFTTTELPVPPTAKPLRQGRWLSKEELYQLVIEPNEVVEVVPPGDKSNCYLSVDNERNMKRLSASTTKKCDFFDDCGTWDREKGNTVKTTYVVTDDSLRHVELKNNLYSTKMRQQKKVVWVPLDPQPESQNVVTISRYYATSKTDPSFEKRVSYFVRKTDTSLGNVAVYEYRGIQPKRNDPHGNAKTNEGFVRTNPKTFDQIQAKIKTNKKPREIFAELKQNDSLTCARDFDVIRSKKHNDKKKENRTVTSKTNIADEILQVIGMINSHPYVQTIVHNKDMVPAIICYTKEQMTDLKNFLTNKKEDPLGIDRTFNLGSFYVTTIVYKNQRIVRKETRDEHPIFLGPVLLHKEATYKVCKTFLEHVSTELDNGIDSVELRISDHMEFGSDDEKALTKAIDHVFPQAKRYLCTKHLKDNLKNYCQNKVGMPKKDREEIMTQIFGDAGLAEANTTVDFLQTAEQIDNSTREKYPVFAKYFESNLKARLQNYVFRPNRSRDSSKQWTNNNAESLNNILKLSTSWRPKSTHELIEKLYQVTHLHFMDYRSAMHSTGNYRLCTNEKHYLVDDALWRCKTEEDKRKFSWLSSMTRKRNQNNSTSLQRMGRCQYRTKQRGQQKNPMPPRDP